ANEYAVEPGDREMGRQAAAYTAPTYSAERTSSACGETSVPMVGGSGTSWTATAITAVSSTPSSMRASGSLHGMGRAIAASTAAATITGAPAQTYPPPTAKTDQTIIAPRSHATSDWRRASGGRGEVVV